MKTYLKKPKENIPNRLIVMRKKSVKEIYIPPFVVISGAWNIPGTLSWRELKGKGERTNRELEMIGTKIKRDVERITEKIIKAGWKVIVGGALGVDYFATKKIYDMKKLDQLLVMFPSRKGVYLERLTEAHFDKDIISRQQLDENNGLLSKISNEYPGSIYEPRFESCDEKQYYIRNSREAYLGDYLCAFHVDNTEGTNDAIKKFIEQNKFVYVHRYEVVKKGWTERLNENTYNIEKSGLTTKEIEDIFGPADSPKIYELSIPESNK